MVDSTPVELGARPGDAAVSLLSAVGDPVRWSVLERLADGPRCVCDLRAHVPVAPNLLSYHLKVLRDARLVTTSRRGRWVDYTLAEDAHERLVAALPTVGRVSLQEVS
ncbi:metalloregulator ArsR/SmtB family transcription factor [Cellulomonas sp. C5510]|nr:metalloregulator ArsR/SmtB family transcription factor [Cellulomonas sp. C5510]